MALAVTAMIGVFVLDQQTCFCVRDFRSSRTAISSRSSAHRRTVDRRFLGDKLSRPWLAA